MNFLIIFTIILLIVYVESDSKSNRITEIRKSVLNYFSSNPNLAYKSDIDVVANNDWLIEKFLYSRFKNSEPAKALIDSLMAWKKDNILELNDTSFPSEFYALGYVYEFGAAKNGLHLAATNMVCAPPTSKIDPLIIEWSYKFVRYIMRKIMFSTAAKGFGIYGYFGQSNVMDADIPTITTFLNTFNVHYPQYPPYAYIIKLHGGFVTVFKTLLTAFIPNYENFIKFPDTEAEIEQYISLDQIPAHIDGRDKSFGFIPKGVKSVKCKHLPQFAQNPTDMKNWEFLKDIRIDCYLKTLQSTGLSSLEEFLREC